MSDHDDRGTLAREVGDPDVPGRQYVHRLVDLENGQL